MSIVPPWPLLWPDNQPRTATRVSSAFRTKFDGALKNVQGSLAAFAKDSGISMTGMQITSNFSFGTPQPADPGIAVWFNWDGSQRCIAVDRYRTGACNLQAVHHVLEARRVELRHAGINMVRTTFKGFQVALPSPEMLGEKHWSVVLNVAREATAEQIQQAYKFQVRKLNENDRADNYMARLQALNVARDQALKERGAS